MNARETLRFKVDENAPAEFVELLRTAGHDAEHALEESLGGAPDATLAEVARKENRAVVTLDLDFADIRRFPPTKYAGLIVLRPAAQHRSRLIRVFTRVIELLATERLVQRLWIVDESGIRVRE